MSPEELKLIMDKHGLNVKSVAWLIHVSCRRVYRWLDGTLAIPEREVEYLTLKLKSVTADAPKQTLRVW